LLGADRHGEFTTSHKGDPALAGELSGLVRDAFGDLVKSGGKETVILATGDRPIAALAALIPGGEHGTGILCLGRSAHAGAVLPDEREFLLGYAQTTALALQRILLRENLESTLIDMISSFVSALESKDLYLRSHSARVSLYAAEIAGAMQLSPAQVFVTRRAGILHDLGKLVI